MSNGKYIIGKGTILEVAPLNECERVIPPNTKLTVSAGGALAGAETLNISMSPAITQIIKASATENNAVWLDFIEPSGRQHLVKVLSDIEPGDTALTVAPLKRAIAVGAVANFPLILKMRQNANLSASDNSVDINTFDNDGFADSISTMIKSGLEANGYYDPTSAGYRTCLDCRFKLGEVFWRLKLPKPGCEDDGLYTQGDWFWGFAGVSMPIESSPENPIQSNISFTPRGKIYRSEPV